MTRIEKAKIMLDVLDLKAPVQINWNNEDRWLSALEEAILTVEEEEAAEKENEDAD